MRRAVYGRRPMWSTRRGEAFGRPMFCPRVVPRARRCVADVEVGMAYQMVAPRLVGSRESAQAVLATIPHDLTGQRVALNCRELRSGSPSFADEIVRVVLVERRATELALVGASERFAVYVRDSAQAHDVVDRLLVRATGLEMSA